MKKLQITLIGALAVVLVSFGALLAYRWYNTPPELHGTLITEDWPTTDFTLAGRGNQPVKLSDFQGKLVLLYFGYTHCPDMCPMTLADARVAMQALGDAANEIQLVMVSVDPERDTPDWLNDYVQRFDERFLGVTGSIDEVTAAATAYGASFYKVEGSTATGYLIAHSTSLLVLDREGHVRLIFPFGTRGEEMANDLRYILSL